MSSLRRVVLALCFAPLAGAAAPSAAQEPALSRAEIDRAVDTRVSDALARYRELLRFPNDALDPDDIARQTEHLSARFEALGFETRLVPSGRLPDLFAERRHPGAVRTVLVYLQSDGQPVDPAAWDQPDPWDPVVKEPVPGGGWRVVPWEAVMEAARRGVDALEPEWRIFARSASDSKGPVSQFLAALEILDEQGVVPDFDLKVIVDSEEELGSPGLPDAVRRDRELLDADMLVIFDGPPHASGEPTLTFGARGIATVRLTTYGPRVPQHSGHYGNYAPNPALGMARILASMKDEHGRVVIPGWYDGVELDDRTLEVLAAVPDDEEEIRRELGIATPDSVGGSLQEALQYPSLNIRGLRSGWVLEQARTIIPATAVAEIDVRLVVESEPDELLRRMREHVEGLGYRVLDREPTEEERLAHPRLVTFEPEVSYAAFRTPFDSEPGVWLTRAFRRRYGEAPIRLRTAGGSIPIAPFVETLDLPAVMVPTVNPDNNQHSPDENLRMADFVEGIAVMLSVLVEPLDAGDGDGGGAPRGEASPAAPRVAGSPPGRETPW